MLDITHSPPGAVQTAFSVDLRCEPGSLLWREARSASSDSARRWPTCRYRFPSAAFPGIDPQAAATSLNQT